MGDIVFYPAPILRLIAPPVRDFDENLKKKLPWIMSIMRDAGAIGLAAPQVGWSARIIVIADGKSQDGAYALINPIITRRVAKTVVVSELCLSLPTIRGTVKRSPEIDIEAIELGADGEFVEACYTLRGAPAIVVQHEVDHLDGVLMIDKMSKAELSENRLKIEALEEVFAEEEEKKAKEK